MNGRLFNFEGGSQGAWRVTMVRTLAGEALPHAPRVAVSFGVDGGVPDEEPAWSLIGIASNERYVTRAEKERLAAIQEGLGRKEATCAALIPIGKNAAWWAMTQDERRTVFEARSAHIGTGLEYLPAIARRLLHCRDLARSQPFDFLTWFEFAPAHTAAFDDLLATLRATPEWEYVDREVELRLDREDRV